MSVFFLKLERKLSLGGKAYFVLSISPSVGAAAEVYWCVAVFSAVMCTVPLSTRAGEEHLHSISPVSSPTTNEHG